MAHGKGKLNNIVESGRKSIGFGSFFSALWKFVAFGVLSALPYIITNLDKVGEHIKTASIWNIIFSLLGALSGSVWTGMVIAGGTIWDSIVHYHDVLGTFHFGTILYLIVVIPALLLTIFQPVKIIAEIFEGDKYNPILAFTITIALMLLFSAVCYYANDGQTITSGITHTIPSTDASITNTSSTTSTASSIPPVNTTKVSHTNSTMATVCLLPEGCG